MAKRNGDTELAVTIFVFAMILPIIIIIYLVKGIIALIKFICIERAKRKERKIYKDILKTNIQEQLTRIDNLDGWEFEKYSGELLKMTGFKNVIITKGSGDFGADIVAEKDNDKYAFQCKRFSSAVGPKTIGEVLRGMNKYKCNKGVIITNNYFTKQAIQEAKVSNIELWDRDKLSILIRNNKDYITLENNDSSKEQKEKIENEEKCNRDKDITNINDNDFAKKETNQIEDEFENNFEKNVTDTKTIVLIAGYYEVDEDIEEGKYVIEAIEGNGYLMVKDRDNKIKVFEHIGKDIDNTNYITKYNNLKLQFGDIIKIENSVKLRFYKIL